MLKQRFIAYQKLNPHELCKEDMQKIKKEIEGPKTTSISDQYADFLLWSQNLPSRQERFAEFLSKKIKDQDLKILEVGCGRRARLSRILNQKGYKNITCIDPRLDDIQNCSIKFIKDKFDYRKIDLSSYDIIIAQEPCDATEHIVRACVNQRKPFIMTLCGVPHNMINGYMPESAEDWYWRLVDISRDEIKLRFIQLDPIFITPILRTNKI